MGAEAVDKVYQPRFKAEDIASGSQEIQFRPVWSVDRKELQFASHAKCRNTEGEVERRVMNWWVKVLAGW